jgi:glycosyltransferase involved in cell wall biosynthesis
VSVLHQLLPVLDPGDAVSGHTLQLQAALRSIGVDSDIYCERTHPRLEGLARNYQAYPGGPAIYHVAIGSRLAEWFMGRSDPLLLDYHNLTPASFFESWDPGLVHGTAWGRRQLPELAARTLLGMADSRFNENELIEAGCAAPTAVVPILFDRESFAVAADDGLTDRLRKSKSKANGGADWLFVGRLVPNKCQHDVIAAFAWYRRVIDPKARLHLVGGASSRIYEDALRAYVAALELSGAVTFTGPVAPAALTAYFECADVFVCLSEHEGFCVPVLEAFAHTLPVVAFAAGAVPETLGDGGLLLRDKTPAMVGEAVARVLDDPLLKSALTARGSTRLDAFSLSSSRERFLESVMPVLERL